MTSQHSTNQDGIIGKICTKCGLWYPLSEFSLRNSIHAKDNLVCWCKDCTRIYRKNYRLRNLQKELINDKLYRVNNPNDYRLKNAKMHDKRRGLGNTLLFDNPFPENIPVVGHHISDGFKVYLPRSLHLNHYAGNNTKRHRDELKSYVEAIYEMTYIIDRF